MKIYFLFLLVLPAAIFCRSQAQVAEQTVLHSRQAAAAVHVNRVSAGRALYFFYKNFISSQDGPSCRFTPSCSGYALGSVEKYGLIRGWLMAGDRLLRCNRRTDEMYKMDRYGLYLDPVSF